jgi:hypothetical protein
MSEYLRMSSPLDIYKTYIAKSCDLNCFTSKTNWTATNYSGSKLSFTYTKTTTSPGQQIIGPDGTIIMKPGTVTTTEATRLLGQAGDRLMIDQVSNDGWRIITLTGAVKRTHNIVDVSIMPIGTGSSWHEYLRVPVGQQLTLSNYDGFPIDGFNVTAAYGVTINGNYGAAQTPVSTLYTKAFNVPGAYNYMLIQGNWNKTGIYVPGTSIQILSWDEMMRLGFQPNSDLNNIVTLNWGEMQFIPIEDWWDALKNGQSIIKTTTNIKGEIDTLGFTSMYYFLSYLESQGRTYNHNGTQRPITASMAYDLFIPSSAGITKIAPFAFAETSVKTVVLPNTITSIGDGAFSNCYLLNNINLPTGLAGQALGEGVFFGCVSLKAVEIPAALTEIPNDAFGGCTSLETVTFVSGSKIKDIGDRAFMYCTSLTNIYLGTTPGQLPYDLETIGAQAFCLCQNLEQLKIPAKVWSIGMYAFALWDLPDDGSGKFCGISIEGSDSQGVTIQGNPIFGFSQGMMGFNRSPILAPNHTCWDWGIFMSWKTVWPWADNRGTSIICKDGRFPIVYYI